MKSLSLTGASEDAKRSVRLCMAGREELDAVIETLKRGLIVHLEDGREIVLTGKLCDAAALAVEKLKRSQVVH